MGRKKLNFKLKDFKKSDAQAAGFKTKAIAIKFFKSTPKNKLQNFNTVDELTNYIKNQKSKLETLGLDIDLTYKQKSRLTKQQKQNKKIFEELDNKISELLNSPEEIESNIFQFNFKPKANDILRCANKFYQNNGISIPRNHDYTNFKKEKKKTFNYKYNDQPLELENILYSIFNQQKYRYKINISFAFTLLVVHHYIYN